MNASEVRKYDTVEYVARGGQTYAARALGQTQLGVNPGTKAANWHLTLAYLNEEGVRVQVNAAPLLVAAWTATDRQAVAETMARAEWEDTRRKTQEAAPNVEAALERMKTQPPATAGWQPVRLLAEIGIGSTENLIEAVDAALEPIGMHLVWTPENKWRVEAIEREAVEAAAAQTETKTVVNETEAA